MMKRFNQSLALFASALFFASTSSAFAGHSKHLWSDDFDAYRSYRPTGKRFHRYTPPLRAARARFTDDYLIESLKTLSGVSDPVLANRGSSEGRAAAREFMRKEFESFGFKVSEHAYRAGMRTGTNLIAEKAGKSGKFLIVSAHYDSVNNAGADDDGTGVVAMLGTAQLLRNRELTHGVRFVAFDQEELGLVGSSAYVRDLVSRGEKNGILGDLQMEMMGFNGKKDGKFHVISCKREDSQFLVDAFTRSVHDLGTGLEITEACTKRSDHAAFWKNDMPAIVISENFFGGDSSPCYHKSCDTIDRMHLDYFVKVADVAANAVLLVVAP
jgi:hypothetical protein